MLNIRTKKIKTKKTVLTFLQYNSNEDCRFGDEEGGFESCIVADRDYQGGVSFFEKCKVSRGSLLTVLVSRGKNKIYKKRVIIAILKVEKPKQLQFNFGLND